MRFLGRKRNTSPIWSSMNINNPTNPGKNHTKKETEAVNSYDKTIHEIEANGDSYAAGSGVAEKYAHITEPSEGTSVAGVDKSVVEQGDKSVDADGWNNSEVAPSPCVGKNLDTACESARLIARANQRGCSDRDKEALFQRFVELNVGSARAAFLVELAGNLYKRGFRDVKKQIAELTFRGKSRTESIVEGQVLSILRVWFFDPSLTKNYDPSMGVLLSTYRRHDIRVAIREIVRECVPLAEVSNDVKVDETEDQHEVVVFRGTTNAGYHDAGDVFAFDESEFGSAYEAQAECAEETIRGIATGDYKQSECFRQLLDVLKSLIEAGKLKVNSRRIFILSIVHNSTVTGEIVGLKANAIRQATRRVREKLHAACDAGGDELQELKGLLVALEARSN